MPRSGCDLRTILAAALALAAAAGAEAAPSTAAAILGQDTWTRLQSAGKIVRTSSDGKALLIPSHPATAALAEALAAEKPGLLVETLFAIPRSAPADRAAELASVYGLLESFSSLKGIQYYSVSHGSMRTLFEESYRVASASSRSALPDPQPPTPSSLPAGEDPLVFQKDLTFGGNVYQYSLKTMRDSVYVSASNLGTLYYGIVPMVGAGGMRSRLVVILADDALIFYSASVAEAPGLFKSRIGESLANRAEALFRWLERRYKGLVLEGLR
jgi:hypothetical protein